MHLILVEYGLEELVVELKSHISAISGAKSTKWFVFSEDGS